MTPATQPTSAPASRPPARLFLHPKSTASPAKALSATSIRGQSSFFPPGVTARVPAQNRPTRHKLLDLVGDAYLVGGPPVGRMRAVRPGHAANAAALRQACAEGILVRIRSTPGWWGMLTN